MNAKYLCILVMIGLSFAGKSFAVDKDAKTENTPATTGDNASKAEAKPEGEKSEAQIPPYVLKRSSVLNIDPKSRAPFWRIGWQKPDPTKPTDPTEPAPNLTGPPPGTFKITSVLIGPPSIAVINGRAFEEGEYINLKRGEQKQRVLIRQIIQEGVWFELDKQVFFEYIAREPDPKFNKQDELTPKEEFEVIVRP